ncbi:MAG: RNA methyltransferase [Rhodospirillaceae bacterium]
MRGYFGIGVEGITKPYNVGTLFRTAHAFEASFAFTIGARYDRRTGHKVDTSDALGQMPFYRFPDIGSLMLPEGCRMVGIELCEDAIELPSFRHPQQAAYLLGAERHGLSEQTLELCDFVIKIPMRFSINLGIAGALVMYDRMLCHGRFAERPVGAGGPKEAKAEHVHGGPKIRNRARRFSATTEPAATATPFALPDASETFRAATPEAEIAQSLARSAEKD